MVGPSGTQDAKLRAFDNAVGIVAGEEHPGGTRGIPPNIARKGRRLAKGVPNGTGSLITTATSVVASDHREDMLRVIVRCWEGRFFLRWHVVFFACPLDIKSLGLLLSIIIIVKINVLCAVLQS